MRRAQVSGLRAVACGHAVGAGGSARDLPSNGDRCSPTPTKDRVAGPSPVARCTMAGRVRMPPMRMPIPPRGVLVAALAALAVGRTQAQDPLPPPEPQPAQVAPEPQGVEVLTRGPVHEAFAEPVVFDPQPRPIVPKAPPPPIDELPPDQKPEGDQVQWIPGYWSWDDERDDFIWISGLWRLPPPGRQWVPGYWNQVEGGYQW